MENLKDKITVVADCGLFVELALTLAKSFKKVYYFTPWNYGGFPDRFPELSGVGFSEITSIDYLFTTNDRNTDYNFDKVDIFIFPELYFSDIEIHLRSLGKRVWGSADGQWLELDRYDSKKIMTKSGMPVNKTIKVKGISKLKDYLKSHDDLYVKISHWRGLVESFKHDNYRLTEPLLTNLENELGAIKESTDFILEQPVDCIVEAGIDTYIIDGQIPENVLSGIELKDQCYAGKIFEYSKLPKLIKLCTDNIAWYFKEKQYRNFYSNEIRVDHKKVPYVIDHTCRTPAPPMSLVLNMMTNLAQVIWFGAEGIMIQPKYSHEYGVLLIGNSDFLRENFLPIYFPEEIRENVKLRFGMKQKGTYYLIPQTTQSTEAIDVVATGDSFEECYKKIRKYTEQIKAYGLVLNCGILDKVQEELDKSSKIGLMF